MADILDATCSPISPLERLKDSASSKSCEDEDIITAYPESSFLMIAMMRSLMQLNYITSIPSNAFTSLTALQIL